MLRLHRSLMHTTYAKPRDSVLLLEPLRIFNESTLGTSPQSLSLEPTLNPWFRASPHFNESTLGPPATKPPNYTNTVSSKLCSTQGVSEPHRTKFEQNSVVVGSCESRDSPCMSVSKVAGREQRQSAGVSKEIGSCQ